MGKAKRMYVGELTEVAVRQGSDQLEDSGIVELGRELGERYWAAALAILGSSKVSYGKNLWIENGLVFEQGLGLHHFLIAQILRANLEGSNLEIVVSPKRTYGPRVSEGEGNRFIDDLEEVTSYAKAIAEPGWATDAADLEGDPDADQQWQYKHIFLAASPARDAPSHVFGGITGRVGRYPRARIEEALNALGQRGWQLVAMEPHWFHERVGVSLATEVTRPKAIIGWYCTFLREARDIDGASRPRGDDQSQAPISAHGSQGLQ